MGRPAIAKKKNGPSAHSRAARRATSPGINLDKSLKNLRPPTDPKPSTADPAADNSRPAVLGIHRAAGVHKPTTTRRKASADMSSRARKRRERGADMALAVAERTAHKVEDSWDRARSVAARRKTWDVINGKIDREMDEAEKLVNAAAARGAFAVLNMEGEGGDGSDEDLVGVARAPVVVPDVLQRVAIAGDGDEEIL